MRRVSFIQLFAPEEWTDVTPPLLTQLNKGRLVSTNPLNIYFILRLVFVCNDTYYMANEMKAVTVHIILTTYKPQPEPWWFLSVY